MEIAAARVASFHYTLTDDAGQIIDKSPEGQPLQYVHGAGNIIPGLEKALLGKQVGDTLKVAIAPEEAYGVYHEEAIQIVPRDAFQGIDTIEPGMQFQASGPQGAVLVTVAEVNGDQVKIDGNHPLAGKTLHFDVTIAEVRDATADEQAEGNVAG